MIKLTINNLLLTSNTNLIPAQGSANIPVELINASTDYSDYALIPCVGWTKNGIIISTTREVIDSGETKTFTIPSEAFLQNGLIYISVGLVKDNENAKTQTLAFKVSMAPTSDVQLPSDGSWETAVSSLVTSLFNDRFENEINQILENSKTLNEETQNLQQQINTAIGYLGEYKWSGTQIRFKLGDGTWGPYKDIAGDFVTNASLVEALANYCPYKIGDIYQTTNETNPSEIWPKTELEQIEGEVLGGYKKGDPNFGTLGKSIGEAEHTLTIDEMPQHSHAQYVTAKASVSTGVRVDYNEDGASGAYEQGINTGDTGNGRPHNNIQPTRIVMIWIRTA